MDRLLKINLSQVADVIGLRIICGSVASAKATIDVVCDLGLPTRLRRHDRVESGYRGTHVELRVEEMLPSGKAATFDVEVQVRTYYQHVWALRSEAFGEQVKEGGGSVRERQYLKRLSKEIGEWEVDHVDTVQRQLPSLEAASGVAVVRQPAIRGAPIVEDFGLESAEAVRQLVEWERWPLNEEGDALLLAYSGGIETIDTSHSVYMLGSRLGVTLESWMSPWVD